MNHKLQDKLYNHPTSVDTNEIWSGMQKKKKRRIIPFLLLGLMVIGLIVFLMIPDSLEKRQSTAEKEIDIKSTNQKNSELEVATIVDEKLNQQITQESITDNSTSDINHSKITNNNNNTSEIRTTQFTTVIPSEKSSMTAIQKTNHVNITRGRVNGNEKNIYLHKSTLSNDEISRVGFGNLFQSTTAEKVIEGDITFTKNIKREIIDIDKISTYSIFPLFHKNELDIESEFISPFRSNRDHSISINIGTIITQNELDNHTNLLPGIDATVQYNKYLNSKLKIGLGINYIQHREHFTTIYKYIKPNEVDAITTEIYNQDGTVDFLSSSVTVVDQYERSLSIVNTKNRINIGLSSEYKLFRIGNLSSSINGQLNYNLLSWNEGLEQRENYAGPYDINTDEINVINKDNSLSYRFGLGLSYSISERILIGLTAQRYISSSSFYTVQDLKYQGYTGGLLIEYMW